MAGPRRSRCPRVPRRDSDGRPDERERADDVRGADHDREADDRLGEAPRPLLVARERPERSADDEGERADDARRGPAQVIEQALQRAGPRHRGTTPRRRGERDVRKEHEGESERRADHEVPGEGAGGGVRHWESPDEVTAVGTGRCKRNCPSRSRPSTRTRSASRRRACEPSITAIQWIASATTWRCGGTFARWASRSSRSSAPSGDEAFTVATPPGYPVAQASSRSSASLPRTSPTTIRVGLVRSALFTNWASVTVGELRSTR